MSQLYNKHDPEGSPADFHRALARTLNQHGIDALLGTPDHVLATMLVKHLDAYGETVATTKRLAKGGPFQPFEHMSYDLNQQPETRTVELKCGHGGFNVGSVDAIMTDPKKFNP